MENLPFSGWWAAGRQAVATAQGARCGLLDAPILLTERDTMSASVVPAPRSLICSAAPAAIEENAALVVTRPDRLPAATEEFLRAMPNLERIVVVGGRSAIGDNVREALQAILRRRVTLGDAPESNEPRP